MYLTRNQAYGIPVPWVRIPPSPPVFKHFGALQRPRKGPFAFGLLREVLPTIWCWLHIQLLKLKQPRSIWPCKQD